jgi:hypothetical protein
MTTRGLAAECFVPLAAETLWVVLIAFLVAPSHGGLEAEWSAVSIAIAADVPWHCSCCCPYHQVQLLRCYPFVLWLPSDQSCACYQVQLLATSLPAQATFFINYTALATLSALPSELLRSGQGPVR